MEIIDESGMMHSIIDKVKSGARFIHYVHIPSGATPETFNLDDNIVSAVPLESVEEFTMATCPSARDFIITYQNNFILDKITEDGHYVFRKKE